MLRAVKKGMVVQYAKDETIDFGGDVGKLHIKAGTRAIIQAGGNNPIILAHAKFKDEMVNYQTSLKNAHEMFEVVEPVFTTGLEKVVMKGREEISGEETRNFHFSLYIGNTVIGGGANSGRGGPNVLNFYGEDGKTIEKILKAEIELAKKNGIKGSKSTYFEHLAMESICEFFLDDLNGFLTIQEYLEFKA